MKSNQICLDKEVLVVFPYSWSDGYIYRCGDYEDLKTGDVVECEVGSRTLTGVVWYVGNNTCKSGVLECQALGSNVHNSILEEDQTQKPGILDSKSKQDEYKNVSKKIAHVKFVNFADQCSKELSVNKGAILSLLYQKHQSKNTLPPYIQNKTIQQWNQEINYKSWFAKFRKNQIIATSFSPIKPNFSYLTPKQQTAVMEIKNMLNAHSSQLLLTGSTGSGKTDVFFNAIEDLMQTGQVLILLPEIFLTCVMAKRFEECFKQAPLLWHHNISKSAKNSIHSWASSGAHGVLIGTRSALFLPFTNLALIIIDEEHDQAYKQDFGIRYYAHHIAHIRSKIYGTNVLYVSATPNLEHCRTKSIALSKYALQGQDVQIVDMKSEKGIISQKGIKLIKQTISNGKCVLLFLNRKGFAPVVVCQVCDKRLTCKRCSTNMVFYKKSMLMICHSCAYHYVLPPTCCDKPWKMFGVGIEKVQETVNLLFPKAVSMCVSSELKKSDYDQIYQKIHDGCLNIIIGTQSIAQGHHIPTLDAVIMLDTDTGLMIPTYQANELMYQLIMQVKGRCGRTDSKGKFILQTHFPEHELFDVIKDENNEKLKIWLQKQLEQRKKFNWPPFCKLVSFILQHSTLAKVKDMAKQLAIKCRQINDQRMEDLKGAVILGPIPSIKKANIYHYRILIKYHKREQIESMLEHARRIKAVIDFYPRSFT